jgi:HEPN domain-containing protein
MQPHIDEAWRSLRLADHDIVAFDILKQEPEAHVSIVNFHAQQAVEKSLKAVLYSRQIEFDRTHDLVKLARLLGEHEMALPVSDDQLRLLNPFAVTFRYDDMEIDVIVQEDVDSLVADVREWAEEQVRSVTEEERVESAGED